MSFFSRYWRRKQQEFLVKEQGKTTPSLPNDTQLFIDDSAPTHDKGSAGVGIVQL